MYIIFLVIAISILFTSNTYCSNDIEVDSIKIWINDSNAANKNEKVDILTKICQEYLRRGKLGEATEFALQGLEAAQKTNNYKDKVKAYEYYGLTFQYRGDYETAIAQFFEAMKYCEKSNDLSCTAQLRTRLGYLFLLQDNYQSAKSNLDSSLKLWESLKNNKGKAMTLRYIAEMYFRQKQYGDALKYYDQALNIYSEEGDYKNASEIAVFLGKTSLDLGDYDNALVYFNTSLNLHQSVNDIKQIAADQLNIAKIHLKQELYDEAISASDIAEELARSIKDSIRISSCKLLKSEILILKGQTEDAKKMLFQASDDLKNNLNDPEASPILFRIAELFAQNKDYVNAFKTQQLYIKSKNLSDDIERKQALLDVSAKYESLFKVKDQQKKIEMLEVEKSTSRNVKLLLMLTLFLSLVGTYLLYRNYKTKKNDNDLLKRNNEIINRQKLEIEKQSKILVQQNKSLDLINLSLIDEVSDREVLEKTSLAKNVVVEQSAKNMRNYLSEVSGLAHIFSQEITDSTQISYLAGIQGAIANINNAIDELNEYARIDSGELPIENQTFETNVFFSNLHQYWTNMLLQIGCPLKVHLLTELPEKLDADKRRLRQIFDNIFKVIISKSFAGDAIDVNLKSTNISDTKVNFRYTFRIRAVYHSIINAFADKLPDNIEELKKMDMDLLNILLTKRVVSMMNGQISVEKLNENSMEIVVNLILSTSNLQTDSNQLELEKSSDEIFGKKILVVEDNQINQLVVSKILQKANLIPKVVSNGKEADQFLKNEKVDLILMDIELPDTTGFEIAAKIRNSDNEQLRNVPIIALTVNTFDYIKEMDKLNGMNDYVSKPFQPQELLRKINLLLKSHS